MADITIIMPSYNRGKYIAEALDSVFMQDTIYDYYIIVADDCSSDRTVEIVKDYQNRYPDKITLLESDKNQKLYRNVLRAYAITKTDYFCVLDPDDFWIDKHRIQKSIDFLEKNKEYTIYATDTIMLLQDGTKKDFIKIKEVIDSSFEDYLNNRAVLSCTQGSIYRNVVFKNGIPDKMKNLKSETMEASFRGDSFRNALHLFYGKAHHVPDVDSVYRVTTDGLWQGSNELQQNTFNACIYKDLWIFFDKKYPDSIIVTADDDLIYERDWLEKLYKAYKKQSKMIHCHRAHRITFDKQKNLNNYNNWLQEINGVKPSYNNFFTGVGGVLYPPHSLYKDVLSRDLFLRLAPSADDIWFWAMAVLNNTKINIIKNANSRLNYVEDTQTIDTCLYIQNVLRGKNDKQIKNVLEYYPNILEKLDKRKFKQPLDAKTFLQRILSVKNDFSNNTKHKVITLFGLKIKFKIKMKPQTLTRVERE